METATNNGMCRCCASEGTFKDVKSTYHWMGEEEVYSDMLKVCFDITLCTAEDGDNGGICEVCITQLRNAANFKKQVLHTEEQFKKRLHDKMFKTSIVKVEIPRDDRMESDNNLSEDYSGPEFEVPIKEESLEETKPKKRAAKATSSRSKKSKLEVGETSTKQARDETLHCRSCAHVFKSSFNLKRHLRNSHGLDATTTVRRLCDTCGKVFFNSEWLAKHLAKGCPTSRSRVCVKCNVVFDRTTDMYKHMRRMHWSEYRLIKLNCPICGATLRSHEEHDAHLERKHEVRLHYQELMFDCVEDLTKWKEDIESKDNVCFIRRTSSSGGHYYHCYPPKYLGRARVPGRGKVCPARIELTQESGVWLVTYQSTHVCNLDGEVRKKERTQVYCPICGIHLDRYDELNSHLTISHGVDIRTENKQFSTYDDFLTWKSDLERQQTVQFFKRSSTTHGRTGQKIEKSYYFCNRSGPSRSCATKKCSKTLKTGKTCPARITLTWDEKQDTYDAVYQSTHVGHVLSTSFLKLTRDERSMLADRIKKGESLKDILRNCHDSCSNSKLKDLRRTDLYNVIRDFNIDKTVVNYGNKRGRKRGDVATENVEEFDDASENADEIDADVNEASVSEHCVKPTKIYILKLT